MFTIDSLKIFAKFDRNCENKAKQMQKMVTDWKKMSSDSGLRFHE